MGSLRQCLPHTTLSCIFGKREVLRASHSKKWLVWTRESLKAYFPLGNNSGEDAACDDDDDDDDIQNQQCCQGEQMISLFSSGQ